MYFLQRKSPIFPILQILSNFRLYCECCTCYCCVFCYIPLKSADFVVNRHLTSLETVLGSSSNINSVTLSSAELSCTCMVQGSAMDLDRIYAQNLKPSFFGCFLIFPPSLSTMESSCGCSYSMVFSHSSTERLQFSISLKTIVLGIHHVPFPSSKFQPLSRICLHRIFFSFPSASGYCFAFCPNFIVVIHWMICSVEQKIYKK